MSETLKDALEKAGDHDQVDLLTPEAQNLKEKDITNFMNGVHHESLTLGAISSLRKLAKTRIKKGQNVLPMKLSGLQMNSSDDNIGGGIW